MQRNLLKSTADSRRALKVVNKQEGGRGGGVNDSEKSMQQKAPKVTLLPYVATIFK